MASPRPSEPVAVVGMSCRLPGATSPDGLWALLDAGACSITDVPADRFAIDEWHDPTPRPGAITSRRGGFIDGVRDFDAPFFGMSSREAVRTDPRQRLLLETGWEAVADAGWRAEQVAGSRMGVWVSGCMVSEYWDLLRETGDPDLHAVFGAGMFGAAPGRLSHLLDVRGPSVAVDATCAGGLLTVHMALSALRTGEADTALVAGVNLLLGPHNSAALSSGGVLSPEGLCRFGDAAAKGYVRSEGVVAMVLKPLARAQVDGDRVHAVLLGAGVSHDGRSAASQMSPSVEGQEAALRAAYRDAGVDPAETSYVEAHGTGTTVGDRVELTALARVLGERRAPDRPCAVGSVKSNIGHTEAAAGLAGLLKAVLALENGRIPATLHVDRPHEVLATEKSLDLATTSRSWPTGAPPVAGVSSFGLSGANAHVVLTAAPTSGTAVAGHDPARPALVPLSGSSAPAVAALADDWAGLDVDPVDLAHTAALHRTHHRVRAAALVTDRAGSAEALRRAASRAVEPAGAPKVVFVFPGQGGQWPGMTADLLDANPVYAEAMAECDAAVRSELGWSILDLLRRRTPLHTVDTVQPCLWAAGVGLAAVWRDWGVEPDLVIGHSMGEVTAATVSGALTVRDGAAVVCRRARLLRDLSGGAMALLQLGEDAAREAVDRVDGRVTVGAANSSFSSVVAGDAAAVEKVLADVGASGVFCRRIAVDFASHSPHVEPVLEPLRAGLSALRPRAGTVPLRSTLLDRITDGSDCDGDYWAANLRRPVRFASAVRAELDPERPTLFIEMSPHPTMVGAITDEIDLAGAAADAVGSLHRDEPWTVLLQAAGVAYGRGCDLRWDQVNPPGRRLTLPSYPWQREQYWPESAPRATPRIPASTEPAAAASPSAVGIPTYTCELSPDAGGPLPAVMDAVGASAPGREVAMEDVRLAPLPCAASLRLELATDDDGWQFTVRHAADRQDGFVMWTPMAAGSCRTVRARPDRRVDVDAVQQRCHDGEPAAADPALWGRDGEALKRIPAGADVADAAVAALLAAHRSSTPRWIMATAASLWLRPGHQPVWSHAWSHRSGSEPEGDVLLLDAGGYVVGELRGLTVSAAVAEAGALTAAAEPRPTPAPPLMPVAAPVPDAGGVAEQLADAVARVLQMPRDRLDVDAPLGRLGLDSLLAAEVRTFMARYHVDVPTRVLLDGSGVADVARHLAPRVDRPRVRAA